MEGRKSKNKLKSFGKNRQEKKTPKQRDDSGNQADEGWTGLRHQEALRQWENPLFTRYYKELQQLGSIASTPCQPSLPFSSASTGPTTSSPCAGANEEGWEKEMTLFRQPLPTTFWVNDTDPLAEGVGHYLAEFVRNGWVEPIPWYPVEGMGWRILADKTSFRKREELQGLRQFLIQQTALGLISRQEEVSMIPPFLLDIQPTDVCLDMCASPGSKTAQLLVALGRHKRPAPRREFSLNPVQEDMGARFPFDYLSEGLVVANELDTKRANMLVHQVKRLQLLFPFALFTNHDARYFPDVAVPSSSSSTSSSTRNGVPPTAAHPTRVGDAGTREEEGAALREHLHQATSSTAAPVEECLRFDKILCDVVCSGDGTLRKAPHIFKIWTPREAMQLQKLQIQIAMRAAHLLKVGGRLVYSTCSLNPIENEAVVAQLVHRTDGAMKLVDVRSQLLPKLSCAAGMTHWVVTDIKGNVVTQPSGTMHEALFPPHTPGGYTSTAVDALDLCLCMRLLPSHCAGGGFFVAVLDKVKEFRIRKREWNEEEVKKEGKGEAGAASFPKEGAKQLKRSRMELKEVLRQSREGEDKALLSHPPHHTETSLTVQTKEMEEEKRSRFSIPPQFLSAPLSFRQDIETFYHLPVFPMNNVVIRAGTGERELRLTQGSVGSLVSNTALKILQHKTDSLMVVSCGLRLFAHESLSKRWRIAHEAAPLFEHYLRASPRSICVSGMFIRKILQEGKGNYKMMHFETMKDVAPEVAKKLEQMEVGPVFITVDCTSPAEAQEGSSTAPDGTSTIGGLVAHTVGLRARSGLQLQVDHEDIEGFRLRLGLPHSTAEDVQ